MANLLFFSRVGNKRIAVISYCGTRERAFVARRHGACCGSGDEMLPKPGHFVRDLLDGTGVFGRAVNRRQQVVPQGFFPSQRDSLHITRASGTGGIVVETNDGLAVVDRAVGPSRWGLSDWSWAF